MKYAIGDRVWFYDYQEVGTIDRCYADENSYHIGYCGWGGYIVKEEDINAIDCMEEAL